MKKYYITFDEIQVGMVLGENIYNKSGTLLIKETSIITEKVLKIIKENKDITGLYIYFGKNELLKNKKKVTLLTPNLLHRDNERITNNFNKVSNYLKETFENLNINKNSNDFTKRINIAVEDIKENLKLNVNVLNEIITSHDFDNYLYRHSVNVSVLSHFIGQWLGLKKDNLDKLIMAGLLHDLGKCKIEKHILNKPNSLTNDEFEVMKKHPVYSYVLLNKLNYYDDDVLRAISLHHEKIDGSGYPLGLKGDEIPLFARILTVADIFDAMTSDRVYKKREVPFRVLELFQNEAFGKLDLEVVMTFTRKFSEYYLGTEVLLSNGLKGTIIKLNDFDITKPLISVDNSLYIDTSINRNIKIIDFFNGNSHKID